jgi:hypothetical protein
VLGLPSFLMPPALSHMAITGYALPLLSLPRPSPVEAEARTIWGGGGALAGIALVKDDLGGLAEG